MGDVVGLLNSLVYRWARGGEAALHEPRWAGSLLNIVEERKTQHKLEMRRRAQVEDMVKSRVRDKIVARGQEVNEAKLQEYVESKQGQALIDELLAADNDDDSEEVSGVILKKIGLNEARQLVANQDVTDEQLRQLVGTKQGQNVWMELKEVNQLKQKMALSAN